MHSLENATKDFINHCKFEKNLSVKTIKAYQIDLKQLLTFLNEKKHSTDLADITKIQFRAYLEEISTLKSKAS